MSDVCTRLIDSLRAEVSSGSLTVRHLAKEIGVSQSHMQNVVNGKRSLTIPMADRLLQYRQRSVFDLASAAELRDALDAAATNTDAIRYVPVLPGRLGPSHPFPEPNQESPWRSLPSHALAHVLRPVFAELGSDADLEREFPRARFALLDVSAQARSKVSRHHWYAVRWSGGGWIRRLRLDPGRLVVLGQESLRPMQGPAWIDLGNSRVEEHVRALVIWIGNDPKYSNPLRRSGYLVPPPAEDS